MPADYQGFSALFKEYLREIAPTLPIVTDAAIARCWQEPGWITQTFHLSGTAMIGFAVLRHTDEDSFEIGEFCIAPPYRRGGHGTRAIRGILRQRPGKWRLGLARGSAMAQPFWIAALAPFAPLCAGPPLTAHQSGSLHFTIRT